MSPKKIFLVLFILFDVCLFSCSRQKPSTEEYKFDVQFIGAEKIERHRLYSNESKSEKFDFSDDWFECTVVKEKIKNNLNSFYYCSKSFTKKFNVQIELDVCADELSVVRLSQSLYGFAFISSEGSNFFTYNTRQKTAEKLFFDVSSGMNVKIVDYKNGVIVGDVQNGNQNELYLFSTARQIFFKIGDAQKNDSAVKIAGERKLQYADKNGKVNEFDFSKWILSPYEEVKLKNGTTVLKTHVLKDKIQTKCYPSDDSENNCDLYFGKAVHVIGNYIDKNSERNFMWLYCKGISDEKEPQVVYDGAFWLNTDDVELPDGYEQSTITFTKIIKEFDVSDSPRYNSSFCKIEIAVKRNEMISSQSVTVSKLGNRNVCFFNWNDYENGFNYADSFGTYAWNSDTNEIYPVSCMGNFEGCWENLVTNDDKYLFAMKDFAQADFFETVEIMDIATGKSMGRWDFYKSFDYDGDSIVVGDAYYPQLKKIEGTANEDSINYAQEFDSAYIKNDEELSWDDKGLIYVKYRLSLEDFSTEFIGCEYVKGYAF